MGKRVLVLIFVFVLFAGFVSGECIEPSDGMLITKNTILCKGDYRLDNGISIKGNEIYLDCDRAVIEGNFEKVGIIVEGFDVSIKNCNILYFEKGIEAKNSKLSLINSTLAKNSIGVYNIDSIIDYIDSDVSDNLDVRINISIPESQFLMFEDEIDLEEAEYSRLVKVPNLFGDEAIALLDLSGEEVATEEDVSIEIFRQYADDYTKYVIKVIPLKDLIDVKVFVYVPKIVAPDSDYVVLPQEYISHDIVNIDPAQFVFYLTNMIAGEQRDVEVVIKRKVIKNTDVGAIVTYSKSLKPWQNFLVMTLFASSIVFYFVDRRFRKRIGEKVKHL